MTDYLRRSSIKFLSKVMCCGWLVVILSACAPLDILTASDYAITSAALSPNGDKITMAVWPRSGGLKRVLLYDLKGDAFRLLPATESNWQPSEPVFSNDQSMIAVGAFCISECPDKNDRMRHLIFMTEENTWKVVASGSGFRGPPKFLPGDRRLIYVGGSLRPGTRPLARNPEPAIIDLKTGKEIYLSTGGASFYLLHAPQLGPDSSVWFIGIGPSERDLEKRVKALDKQAGNVASIPYQLPVKDIEGDVVSHGGLKIIDVVAAFTGRDDVAHLTVASNRKRVFFVDSITVGRSRLEERVHMLEAGKIRTLLTTRINIERLSVSADGKTALILGDLKRRGRAGLQDFFILDVNSSVLRPLPLLDRIHAFMQKTK